MRPTAAQVQGALKGACQDFANEHGGVADARADEAEQARVRMLLSDLSMSELQAQAVHEAGEGVLAKQKSGADEQQYDGFADEQTAAPTSSSTTASPTGSSTTASPKEKG